MHGLSIEYPKISGQPYLLIATTGWGSALYELVYWDSINKRRIELTKEFVRFETIQKDKVSVENQNNFYHAYCEGILDIIPLLPEFSSMGEPIYSYKTLTGRATFCGARVTMKNGQKFDMPRANETPFETSRLFVKTNPQGLTCTQDYYADQQCNNLVAHMVCTGTFKFDGSNPTVATMTMSRTGHQYAPTSFDSSKNKDYNDRPRTNTAVVIKLPVFNPVVLRRSLLNAIPRLDFGKLPGHLIPSNLTDRIYSQLVIPNVNNIENMTGLSRMRDLIPQLRNIIRRHNIKSMAELYLIWKYEYSTTMLDLKAYMAYFEALTRTCGSEKQMIHLSASSTNLITHYTISFPTYTSSFLEQVGLNLTSANVWDTLPFSFIVDWFIGIGDTLQRLHEENVLTTINVNYCTASTTKTEWLVLKEGPFKGSSVKRVIYNRTVARYFPTPDVDVVFKNPIRHFFDGSALVIANKRH